MDSYTATPSRAAQNALRATSISFLFLAGYVLSQSFLIPIAAIGPSWSIWPCLSDLAFAGLAASALLGSRSRIAVSKPARSLLLSFAVLYAFCWLSFVLSLGTTPDPGTTILDGIYYLFRLSQFLLLYWCVIHIPLDARRLKILGWAVDAAFVIVCASIYLTYFKLVPLGFLTQHLPQTSDVAGSWASYAFLDQHPGIPAGFGTVSYNHSYVAVQVLLLLALRLHVRRGEHTLSSAAFILAALGAVLLTDSRAGFAAVVVFAAAYALRRPKILIGTACLALVILPNIDPRKVESTLERQETVIAAKGEDPFNGREILWAKRLDMLSREPRQILIGGGLGSARANGGSTAHMLYLQILTEMGGVGLLLFALLAGTLLYSLYRYDTEDQPVLWATIALLISATAQETFYPVPALGHFTGFYLVVIAIVLRRQRCTNGSAICR